MKKSILILAIAFIAMFSSLIAEQEIVWWKVSENLIVPDGAKDPGYIYNAIFTPDDRYLLVSCEFRTLLIESETGKYIKDLPVSGVIRFSNDGKYIYTYDNKKFNYETGELIGEFLNKGKQVPRFTSVDVCEKAGIMIGVLQNADYLNWRKDIWVFDLKTMELIEQLGDTNEFYEQITMAQDGSYFNTNSYYQKKDVRIQHNYFWDMKLRKQLFNGFDKQLYIVQYSPDGNLIGSVRGGDIKLFDKQNLEKKFEMIQNTSGALTGVAFSPDSRFFATCGAGSESDLCDVHIWELENGKLSYRYSNFKKNTLSQSYLSYSNSGRFLLGWQNAGIIVYNAIYITTKVDPKIGNDTLLINPNPATNKISIDVNSGVNISYRLINNTGNEINVSLISNLINNKLEINVSSLSNGTYYLIINQDSIAKLYKFIKE